MKIALIGYGNMGQEIEQLVHENTEHTIVSVSYDGKKMLDKEGILSADVAIDFTAPDIVIENIAVVASLGVDMVVGTTGWYDQMDKVKKIVRKHKIGLIYGQNFSVGANIFFKIIEYSSQLFERYEQYDTYGFEVHHSGKKDSPSGTAKKLAEIILKNIARKKSLQTGRLDRQIKSDELHFTSVRAGRNPGMHTISFDSLADEITLTHQAHGRRGFAEGALLAAEFIKNKKGLFRFDELFAEEVK
ncbi:MAG TPA: 4-hydroxy-tetrahydrodipicolinate reductase [Candidatus Acidoferrales bacterium]|nr:4-hydroxy-tetrahydrodipicolinate reductase [Candidatus Acidoferrales bacterium]